MFILTFFSGTDKHVLNCQIKGEYGILCKVDILYNFGTDKKNSFTDKINYLQTKKCFFD